MATVETIFTENVIGVVIHCAGYKVAGDLVECYADTKKAAWVLTWRTERSLEDMCRDT